MKTEQLSREGLLNDTDLMSLAMNGVKTITEDNIDDLNLSEEKKADIKEHAGWSAEKDISADYNMKRDDEGNATGVEIDYNGKFINEVEYKNVELFISDRDYSHFYGNYTVQPKGSDDTYTTLFEVQKNGNIHFDYQYDNGSLEYKVASFLKKIALSFAENADMELTFNK